MDKLPPLLKDFIRSVAPDPRQGPLEELHDRYEERRHEEALRSGAIQPSNFHKGSPEWAVEMRIRDWIRRMEAEKAQADRIKRNPAAPPQKPPAP